VDAPLEVTDARVSVSAVKYEDGVKFPACQTAFPLTLNALKFVCEVVTEFPEILMPQVPLAFVPVNDGA
jgi:hypothetical protein